MFSARYLCVVFIAFVFLYMPIACADEKDIVANVVILEYDDFGTNLIAHELIGMDWWQWDNHGDDERKANIKIIVYADTKKADVAKVFVSKKYIVDYRYVSLEKATAYFRKWIKELENDKPFNWEDMLKPLRRSLGWLESFEKERKQSQRKERQIEHR